MGATTGFYVYALFRETAVPFYVGKGKGDRWACHERASRTTTKSHKSAIIRGMHARGVEVIRIKLHEGLTEKIAHDYEVALIKAIGRGDNGPLVNLTDGGDGITGLKHSPKTLETIAAASRGRQASPQTCERIAAAHRGRKASPEACANMSAAHRGKTLSAQTREKMSAARRGKKKTPEHVEKLAALRRGKRLSVEWRANLSAAHLGKKQSQEHIEKAAATRRGKTQSPEHIAKRVEATRRTKQAKSDRNTL